ncbi:uncharacterized protein RAG0_14549 [Rhynchosporium agropyri]|uniref:Uncharacterized protein n=1 Tax=Rhynchosporium agropyri TaxID=914238 RepID=A0A1E1LHF3_9HELO|nr:uncharacterized protein RAG0_14549 [Rhynchosporium agropyri]
MGPSYFVFLKRGPSHGEYLLREKSLPEYLITQFGRELGKEVESACGTKSVILSIVVYFAKWAPVRSRRLFCHFLREGKSSDKTLHCEGSKGEADKKCTLVELIASKSLIGVANIVFNTWSALSVSKRVLKDGADSIRVSYQACLPWNNGNNQGGLIIVVELDRIILHSLDSLPIVTPSLNIPSAH